MTSKQVLESANIRPSVQRLAVMEFLMNHRTHPTVDEIYNGLYDSIPTLSKTTVYNTLKLFVDMGVAQMLTINEHKTCFDADVTPHAHFLCKRCQKVYDMEFIPFKEDVPSTIDGHKIMEVYEQFKGVCKSCL